MLDSPLHREVQGSPGQVADDDFQCPDVDLCFVFPIQRMEVRRCMLAPEHLDNDTEELAYGGHERTWIQGETIMPPVFVTLPVEQHWGRPRFPVPPSRPDQPVLHQHPRHPLELGKVVGHQR